MLLGAALGRDFYIWNKLSLASAKFLIPLFTSFAILNFFADLSSLVWFNSFFASAGCSVPKDSIAALHHFLTLFKRNLRFDRRLLSCHRLAAACSSRPFKTSVTGIRIADKANGRIYDALTLGRNGFCADFDLPVATFGWLLFTSASPSFELIAGFAFNLADWLGLLLLAAAKREIPKISFFANHNIIAAHVDRFRLT